MSLVTKSRLRSLQLKASKWYLSGIEKRFKDWAVPKVPRCIETYHLTLMTIPCIVATWCVGLLAMTDNVWLLALSPIVVIQYVYDLLDGEVGRRRKTGLIRWGFYTDHFLDYIFIASIILVYYITVPASYQAYVFVTMILIAGFFISTYLEHGATGKFVMSEYGFGPTEGRLAFVILNTIFALTGRIILGKFVSLFLVFLFFSLLFTCYRKQSMLWKKDRQG